MSLVSEHKRLSVSQIRALSSRDAELQTLLSASGPWPDPPFTDIPQCRSVSDHADDLLVKSLGPTPEGLLETNLSIPTCDAYTSSATLTRPALTDTRHPGPPIVLLHPGGFFLGSPLKLTLYARSLASLFNAFVLCPSYRVAPEYPFPVGVNDAWAVLQWAAKHASELGADPITQGFLLGGISSGANFAAVLTRRAADTGLQPPITGTWAPIFMGLGVDASVPDEFKYVWISPEQNRDALVIDEGKAATMWQYYKPDFASPLFNPLATGFDPSKMPKMFVQVAGQDLFRDDGFVLAYALQDQGVEVKLKIYPGVPHSFWVFAPSLAISKQCVKDFVEGFAWLLDNGTESLAEGWETMMAMPTVKLLEDE